MFKVSLNARCSKVEKISNTFTFYDLFCSVLENLRINGHKFQNFGKGLCAHCNYAPSLHARSTNVDKI